MIKDFLKKIGRLVPYIKRLMKYETYYLPGHYYSPIPNHKDILKGQHFKKLVIDPHVIDLCTSEQLKLFKNLAPYIEDHPFKETDAKSGNRFYNRNGYYGFGDADTLQAIIRLFKPNKIIEIGSGYSSLLIHLVNEQYFQNKIKINYIEPFPDRLRKLLDADELKESLIEKRLEEIPMDFFTSLKKGDILFIDSSHVLKSGSDLYYLFFFILPVLKSGVLIHLHDIFNGFEYLSGHYTSKPGFGWNENYFLRAFLMYNNSFQIKLFLNYMDSNFIDEIKKIAPSYSPKTGAAFWMEKL